jgi:SDR family mycofactocin-dependent oxidoreductase
VTPSDPKRPGDGGRLGGRLDGKVALVTGAARGVGRAAAQLLAAEGADVIAVDVCGEVFPVSYAVTTPADLDTTVALVEQSGRRVVPCQVDVRNFEGLDTAVRDAVGVLGRLDVVVANASISTWGRLWELDGAAWDAVVGTNLTGVWHTLKATIPTMIADGSGGAIIITSSSSGLKALPSQAHYVAAKHGVVGLTKAAAIELGPHSIRVNSIHPWAIDTPMGRDKTVSQVVAERPELFSALLPVPISTPEEVAELIVYLASDAGRCITGAQLPIDMGASTV